MASVADITLQDIVGCRLISARLAPIRHEDDICRACRRQTIMSILRWQAKSAIRLRDMRSKGWHERGALRAVTRAEERHDGGEMRASGEHSTRQQVVRVSCALISGAAP